MRTLYTTGAFNWLPVNCKIIFENLNTKHRPRVLLIMILITSNDVGILQRSYTYSTLHTTSVYLTGNIPKLHKY